MLGKWLTIGKTLIMKFSPVSNHFLSFIQEYNRNALWTAVSHISEDRMNNICRSHWPRSLRRRSTAARQLRSWVRITPGAWMFVCCECCVLSGRGLCDGLITRPKETYRLWRVVVCDQETSRMRRLKSATGLWKIQPKGS
jgi:hypothetical protein